MTSNTSKTKPGSAIGRRRYFFPKKLLRDGGTGTTSLVATLSSASGTTEVPTFTVLLTYNGPPDVDPPVPGDFVIINGTAVSITGGPSTFILTITAIGPGDVDIQLPAGLTESSTLGTNLISNLLTVEYIVVGVYDPLVYSEVYD